MSKNKIPCGGFELSDSLEIKDGKLGLAPGAGGSQADWNVTDSNDPAFIKNRPFGVEKGAVARSISGLSWKENSSDPIYLFEANNVSGFNPFASSGKNAVSTNLQVIVNDTVYSNFNVTSDSYSFGYYFTIESDNCPIKISTVDGYTIDSEVHIYSKTSNVNSVKIIDLDKDSIKAMSSDYIEFASTTSGSTKKFKITVDDTGTISATEV